MLFLLGLGTAVMHVELCLFTEFIISIMLCSSKYFLVSFFPSCFHFLSVSCFPHCSFSSFPVFSVLFGSLISFCVFYWITFAPVPPLWLPSCVSPVSPSCARLQCIQILVVPFVFVRTLCMCLDHLCQCLPPLFFFGVTASLSHRLSDKISWYNWVQFSTLFRYKNMFFLRQHAYLRLHNTNSWSLEENTMS